MCFRASLDNVYFPSVTLCNINQGRRSFFISNGLNVETPLLSSVLSQAYFGSRSQLPDKTLEEIRRLFSSKDIVTKGLLADIMYANTSRKAEAKASLEPDEWVHHKDFPYIDEAGWYFKTLAAQEPGEDNILAATYGRKNKNVSTSTHLLPFFGTDYGLCRCVFVLLKSRFQCTCQADRFVVSGRVVSRHVVSLTFDLLDTWTFGHLIFGTNELLDMWSCRLLACLTFGLQIFDLFDF